MTPEPMTLTDCRGRRWRAAGRIPLSELLPGDAYLTDGAPGVVCFVEAPDPGARPLSSPALAWCLDMLGHRVVTRLAPEPEER